jgi:hypothetical protein
VIERLQALLERVYHLDIGLDVRDFCIGGRELGELRARGARASSATEQLLVLEEEGDALLALFIDDAVMARAGRPGGVARLDRESMSDFCLLTEGVSHFVYLVWKAGRGEPVTQLELELQAEVDKYLACFIASWEQDRGRFPERLREALFERASFRADLDGAETERYRTANRLALEYCGHLERAFLKRGGLHGAMPELRRFYRMTHPRKLDHIAHCGQ